MSIIILSKEQVANYLTLCFYRPNVFPNEEDAASYKESVKFLLDNNMLMSWLYNPLMDNIPTFNRVVDGNNTPQGGVYWTYIHNRIMDTTGYVIPISSVLNDNQKKKVLMLKKEMVLMFKNTFDEPPGVEDFDETREII